MSLMRLLVLGRSINESLDAPNRYRLCRKSFLPKFSSKKKPAAFETPNKALVSKPVAVAPLEKPRLSKVVAMPQEQQKSDCRAKADARSKAIRLPRINWKRPVAYFQKLISNLTKRSSSQRVSKAKPSQVQPELSLDAVKVVRNELNDSDLEVVAVRKATVAPQQEMAPIISGSISTTLDRREVATAVGRVTTRLMAVLHL